MKISYINSLCVRYDAISNSIRDEISWLVAAGHDVRFFAYACDYTEIIFTKVDDIKDVVFDQHFLSSDLVVFHFGIFYPLFNLLPLISSRAKRLVIFHNITPREFVSPTNYETIEKSFSQLGNMMWADHIVCDSETNLGVIRDVGIERSASVLSLAIQLQSTVPTSKPSFADGIIRLVFVGRFVRAKGPHDFLSAVKSVLAADQACKLRIDLIGNVQFSEASFIESIQQAALLLLQECGDRIQILFHGNAAETVKQQLLRNADLFVLPTYHEGFCVPIIEAIASGCKVIAYKNSNVPAISGGLALLTPTGDLEKLSIALTTGIRLVSSARWVGSGNGGYKEYSQKASKYISGFDREKSAVRFLEMIKMVCQNQSMPQTSELPL